MLKKKDTIVMTFKSIDGYFSNIAQIVLSSLSKCYMDLANSNTPAGSGLFWWQVGWDKVDWHRNGLRVHDRPRRIRRGHVWRWHHTLAPSGSVSVTVF